MEDEILDPEREDDDSSSDAESKSGISADLIRGHINTIILRTLYERDKYGYEIIEEIESKSHGQYSLKQPTLYSALKRLENQGYINAYWKTDEVSQGGRRKYYTLTDSGREVTERNQAEWEYSRTVIDNLISDRNFDFTQPPPAPVDFKILKSSTSRVRTVKDSEYSDEGRIVNYDEPSDEQVVEIEHRDATPIVITEPVERSTEDTTEKPSEPIETAVAEQSANEAEGTSEQHAVEQKSAEAPSMSEEERKILHENYLRLISEPVEQKKEVPVTPYADSIDAEKMLYVNRPEAERDYRNLINNLFVNTVRETPAPVQESAHATRPVVVETIRIDDATAKAKSDGLNVETSEYTVGTRRKKYNRGSTLFKCALIIGIIMLFEFAMCLIFQKSLGVSLAYPFVIFILAVAEVLIFGVLRYTDIGKSSRRPSTKIYLSACLIITIILILIVIVTSVIIDTIWTSAGSILANIVIPCLVALNIPLFALLFYLFSK